MLCRSCLVIYVGIRLLMKITNYIRLESNYLLSSLQIRPDLGRIEKWVLRNAFDDEKNPYLPKVFLLFFFYKKILVSFCFSVPHHEIYFLKCFLFHLV
jgi:hypothetical protein